MFAREPGSRERPRSGMPGRDLPEGLESRAWAELSARIGRADKPALLVHAIGTGVLSEPGELRNALEDTWTGTEWPGLAAARELWLMLFEEALEPRMYLDETDLCPVQTLLETLQSYGAAAAGNEEGMSWTTSFERAHWFATRLGAIARRPHRIFEMDAPVRWWRPPSMPTVTNTSTSSTPPAPLPACTGRFCPRNGSTSSPAPRHPNPPGVELDGLGSMSREKHPLEPSGRGVPDGWVTRAEAIGMVLGMGQGWSQIR